jgi:hypothetical protein
LKRTCFYRGCRRASATANLVLTCMQLHPTTVQYCKRLGTLYTHKSRHFLQTRAGQGNFSSPPETRFSFSPSRYGLRHACIPSSDERENMQKRAGTSDSTHVPSFQRVVSTTGIPREEKGARTRITDFRFLALSPELTADRIESRYRPG